MTPVQVSQALFSKMTIQELAAYQACPLSLQDYFESVMMDKYGIKNLQQPSILGKRVS